MLQELACWFQKYNANLKDSDKNPKLSLAPLKLFLAVLGLCCCMWAFSSFRKWGLPFTVICRFLIVVDSLDAKHGALGGGLGSCDTLA